ncbi:MAG: chromate transporter [Clostridiales bacterium]|nr:chromate transporter [Clostridiales bacterium]
MIFLDLLLGFLKVGLFSFGGAYGAIPLIRDVVLDHGWLEEDILTDMIAVSESTPGPIMVNLATYVGSSQAGFPGALTATAAVVFPSFVIILALMILFRKLTGIPLTQAILGGLKACVVGIVTATGIMMIFKTCFGTPGMFSVDETALCLTAVLAACYFGSRKILKRGISPIALIGLSAAAGILVYGWR